MESHTFTTSLDRTKLRVTCGVTLLLVGIAALLWALALYAGAFIILLCCLLAVIILYGLQPRRIEVTLDSIVLHCPFHTKRIPRTATTRARRMRADDLHGLWRKFGSSGIWGEYGLFASQRYPKIHCYAKRRQADWIMIYSSPGPACEVWVVTPDDGEAFLALFPTQD